MDTRTLTRLPIFEGCSEEAARQLLAEAPNSVRRYPTDSFIARQGDTCRSLYILCSGTVRAQMESAEGKLLTIEIMKAPEVLAPAFIYAAENRFPVHIALESCEVFLMDKNRFLQFIHQHPAVMQNFLREISDRSQFPEQETERIRPTKSEITSPELPANPQTYPQPTGSSLYPGSSPSFTRSCTGRVDSRRKNQHGRKGRGIPEMTFTYAILLPKPYIILQFD